MHNIFFSHLRLREVEKALPGDQYFSILVLLTSKVKQLVARRCLQFGASLVATHKMLAARLTPQS